MGTPKKGKNVEESKTCPGCKGELHNSFIRVRARGWKPHYHCKCGVITPTAELRR